MLVSNENFSLPLDAAWSTSDIIKVTNFYALVADAYETGVNRESLLAAYRDFKEVVPMKFEEKQLDRDFTAASGYSIYRAMKAAREATQAKLKLSL
ncbi:UPF0223 family protein [Periweissella ghanensis]|uniref:Uncharacterized protein n=1 Tax=Periweissella ghanensis TaxID=467997 RepID=A0ABM8Z8K3_9LACO|nr:UPF0223 family protein [Periweissella ghanensis]MCM0600820.1 UPF0223 family protein [Periweissella ghanensis]CAH0417764.1 hypothetical protein WGH24286_00177 [Periweissella ghanensis]